MYIYWIETSKFSIPCEKVLCCAPKFKSNKCKSLTTFLFYYIFNPPKSTFIFLMCIVAQPELSQRFYRMESEKIISIRKCNETEKLLANYLLSAFTFH